MSLFAWLSVDLLLEILSYVDGRWSVYFAMVDKSVCQLLIRKVRTIQITKSENLSEARIHRLAGLIENPYRQLSVDSFSYDLNFPTRKLFSCLKYLNIYFERKAHIDLLETLDQLQELEVNVPNFRYDRDNKDNYGLDRLRDLLVQKMHGEGGNFGLKRLRISTTFNDLSFEGLFPLPKIKEIEFVSPCLGFAAGNHPKMNIAESFDLSFLRRLVLTACHIDDVSCLDQIYDLSLINCKGLKDISMLNHNNRIYIDRCKEITDYSKSFKYSYFIGVELDENFLSLSDQFMEDDYKEYEDDDSDEELRNRGLVLFDYSNLLAVNSIYISFDGSLRFPTLPPTLRSLTLAGMMNFTLTLPPDNKIRELILLRCFILNQVMNMERITKLILKGTTSWARPIFGKFTSLELHDVGTNKDGGKKLLKYAICPKVDIKLSRIVTLTPILLHTIEDLTVDAAGIYEIKANFPPFKRLKVLQIDFYRSDLPSAKEEEILGIILQREGTTVEKFIFWGLSRSAIGKWNGCDWYDTNYIQFIDDHQRRKDRIHEITLLKRNLR